jgi:hypothetical protein
MMSWPIKPKYDLKKTQKIKKDTFLASLNFKVIRRENYFESDEKSNDVSRNFVVNLPDRNMGLSISLM